MEIIRKDVVVIGLGGFGSAALWRLAQRGVDVVGLERQGIGHAFPASRREPAGPDGRGALPYWGNV